MGIVIAVTLFLTTAIGQAQLLVANPIWFPRGYGAPIISANPDLLNSTSNDYGIFGAPESYWSPTNDYGPFGAPENINSVTNEYGYGLRLGLIQPVLEPVEVPFQILETY